MKNDWKQGRKEYDAARYREAKEKKLAELKISQPALVEECERQGIDPTDVSIAWRKTGTKTDGWSICFRGKEAKSWEELAEAMIEKMHEHSPKFLNLDYAEVEDPHLFVYDPADIHFNKYALESETGEDYDSQIAAIRCRQGLKGLLEKARGYRIDKVLFLLGNDILNADGPTNSTTKGTHQDTHTLWFDAYLMAFEIMAEQIEQLATIAPVQVDFNPSNHDVVSGFFLAHALKTQFRNHNGVTFNISTAHRKYFRYGLNLIGSTHGDGAKPDKLPLLMAHEAKKDWGECSHYYVYTHHIHHKDSKDYGPVCVESLRSPSGPDGWHARNGYVGAPKTIEAFVHHPKFGQVARFTEKF